MAMISKTVLVRTEVTVEFDDDIMPDDEWRDTFYDTIDDHESLAEHLAFNFVRNGVNDISRLDGFADRQQHEASFHVEECTAECVGG